MLVSIHLNATNMTKNKITLDYPDIKKSSKLTGKRGSLPLQLSPPPHPQVKPYSLHARI